MRARGLELLRRDAGRVRRRIERPAEMLARMAHADARAVMDRASRHRARQIRSQLLVERRARRAARRSRDSARDRPGNHGRPCAPRPTITASAPDASSAVDRALEARHVAIDDDRDRHRLLHGAHRGPVGRALVELAARAAVHGDEPDAGRFGAARKLRRVERVVVPAEPHLQRHRHVDRADRRLDQASAHDRDRASAPSRTRRRSRAWPGSPC